ncbi:MAG: ankyrin repeat domain-containing protein, partial [SAR324 cluster bacterium]|nr:ankyrin repeat domain-containing protein [SAR324 cluster bacterium]
RFFIKHGGYINCKRNSGSTALMESAAEGRTDTVKLLLDAKADPLLLDLLARSALIIAEQQGHLDIVEMLK